ncbi:O-antigen ligase family protein [Aquamicrobium sp. LC103]|uniref:O-antigen ligase family protein n=1 Tax=Aquamicrobium sp. LC103 TaxID=1120658 RepID=UPI00063EC544|nr:O-antigen ligase family protein [Aquamicrobium sp. LC103]TKT81494.1 O-antigen ligase family protein [Aquamicrobium sp. LC103]
MLAASAVFFGVFLSGFVVNEPSPYELYMVPLIAVWCLFGLPISRHAGVLMAIFTVYCVGGLFSMAQMADLYDTPIYLAVTLFLALTSVFFAAVTRAQPWLFRPIFHGWVAAALVTGTLGICGYFNLFPGAEMFTRYDRAMGAFKDPNVFGPFLALPGIYLLYLVLTGDPRKLPLHAAMLLVIVAAIFLSFSRGAWGLFVISAMLMVAALFLQSNSGLFRLRIVLMTTFAFLLLTVAILVALQLPGVGDFFSARAQLVQEYDGGHLGRFARFGIGFQMATEHPFGIGPLMFGRMLGEDTHNIWLKSLMDYGWIGFAAYVGLILGTLVGGFRILFRDRPWQPYLMCAYVVFLGHIGLGTVIDMDHWRHFYLLIGLIWGCFGLEQRHQARLARKTGPSPADGGIAGDA